MYDISIPITAKAIETNKRMVIEWPGYSGLSTVEWMFAPQKDGTTFVSITELALPAMMRLVETVTLHSGITLVRGAKTHLSITSEESCRESFPKGSRTLACKPNCWAAQEQSIRRLERRYSRSLPTSKE